jgi:exosome complex component RRP40
MVKLNYRNENQDHLTVLSVFKSPNFRRNQLKRREEFLVSIVPQLITIISRSEKKYVLKICIKRMYKIVVPGEDISSFIAENDQISLLGGGLTRLRDGRVMTTIAGPLFIDGNRCWIGDTQKRNISLDFDVVIGIIVDQLGDSYSVDIGSSRLANLDLLAFDGASRRNSPNLSSGTLIFARVLKSGLDIETQLTCEALGTGKKKDWTTGETQFGELKGGCVFQMKRSTCRRLMETNCPILSALGKHLNFEVCIGVNGRVWVCADDPIHVILIGAALRSAQEKDLGKKDAEELVETLLASLK